MKTKKMKIAFITAGLMTLSFLNVNAQKGLMLGSEGTPQMSWLLNKDDLNDSKFKYVNTFSGSFGLTGQYGFDKNMGVGINFLYSFQGQRYEINQVERIKKIEYLKIPVMFIYCYELNSDFMLFGKLGPQVGILTSARLTDKDGNNIVANHKEAYEDYDIGAVAAVGVGYKLNDNFIVDAAVRYDYGFTDAENKSYKKNINDPFGSANGNGFSDRADTNNETLGLTIGIRYLLTMKKD